MNIKVNVAFYLMITTMTRPITMASAATWKILSPLILPYHGKGCDAELYRRYPTHPAVEQLQTLDPSIWDPQAIYIMSAVCARILEVI